MVDAQLLEYIKKEISKGFTLDQIKQMLLQYNYPEQTITEAFALLQQQPQQSQQQLEQQTQQLAQSDPQQAQQGEQSQPLQQQGQEQQQSQQQAVAVDGAAGDTGAANSQAKQQTPELSKMQKASQHYVYLLSGLILVIVIIKFITSSFSVSNLIKSSVFLFIAAMTVVYAKQRFVKPKLALLYKIFLVLDIIVLIGLIIKLFK